MSVKEVMQKYPEAKLASQVVIEQLEEKIELMFKVLVNVTERLDYLESQVGK